MSYLDQINRADEPKPGVPPPVGSEYLFPSEDTLIDYSKYEPYLGKRTPLSTDQWDDERARNQGGFEKVLRSTGQMAGTFGTSLASGVAALGSGIVALGAEAATGGEAQGMDIFLNNPVMKGISEYDKFLKEDLLPTYYTKEQQESVLSAATGTDLLNGIGFMASALVPNAFVMKAFGGLSKMAAASKAGKLIPVLEAAEKAGEITNIERQVLSKTAQFFDKAGPVTGALVGRIGESAIEANGVYEQTLESLKAQRDQARDQVEMYGKSDDLKTNELAYKSDEDLEKEAKSLRNKTFIGNMALAANDMAQYTRWFRAGGLGDDLMKQGLKTVARTTDKTDLLHSFLKESALEAGEEGFQFLLSKGAEKAARGKSYLDGLSEASGELFSTVEGQKSMLLGAVLGGGVSTIGNIRSAKENKKRLEAMAESLTANADTTQRFIPGPDGKMIVNPQLTKIATRFAMYEQMKDDALAAGNQDAHDVAEKMQFADLVAAKLEAGQYDEFIEQLREMGKASPGEVKAMFGNLPTKNGREQTPAEVSATKIQEAERVKQMTEGLSLLPKLQGQPQGVMSLVRHNLFAQESLRNQIQETDAKIAAVNGRMVAPVDDTSEMSLLPQDQHELNKLTEDRKGLLKNFHAAAKAFSEAVLKPEKVQQQIEETKENNIQEAIDNEVEKHTETERQVAEAIQNETVIEQGKVVGENPETGDPIIETPEGTQIEMTKTELVEALTEEEEEEDEEDISDDIPTNDSTDRKAETKWDEIIVEEGRKPKTTQLSSSGQPVLIQDGSEVVEDGEKVLHPDFIAQTELFNDPAFAQDMVSNPSEQPKVISFKATIGEIPDLGETNSRRADRSLDPLTQKDLESPEYAPIVLTLVVDGRARPITSYFHTPDYYYKTSLYWSIENDEDMSDAQKEIEHAKNLQKQKDIREKLYNDIKEKGHVIIPTVSKSDGVMNFNPKDVSTKKRKTSPLAEIFGRNWLFPKAHNLFRKIGDKLFQVKTRGVMVVKTVTKQDKHFVVEVLNSKGTVYKFVSDRDYAVGEMLYDVVSPNGAIRTVNIFTKNMFSPEQFDDMAKLILHRLTTGEKTVQIGKEFHQIIGNEAAPGIIDSLIYVGAVKSSNPEAKNSQIFFSKEGQLVLGKKTITAEDPDALAKITAHLHDFKSKPQFKPRSIEAFPEFGIPTKTDKGWTIEDPVKYENYLFAGIEPLISTGLNKTHFVSTYFTFATDPNGNILTEAEKSKESKPVTPEPPAPVVTPTSDVEKLNEKFLALGDEIHEIFREEQKAKDDLVDSLLKKHDVVLPKNTRITRWRAEEFNGKSWDYKEVKKGTEEEFFGKDVWDNIKKAKKEYDVGVKKIENINLEKTNKLEQEQIDLLATPNGLKLRKAWSLGIIEESYINGLDADNYIDKESEFVNGDLVDKDNYIGYYYLPNPKEGEDWDEAVTGATKQEVEDKINARYDAELAALEGTSPVKQTVADLEKERDEKLTDLLPKKKESKGNLDFSAALNMQIPAFYGQLLDMVKEGKDTIAGVKERYAPLLQKLYNEGKLKSKEDVWLAINPKAQKINAEYAAKIAALEEKEDESTPPWEDPGQSTQEKEKEAECQGSKGSPNAIRLDDDDIPEFEM